MSRPVRIHSPSPTYTEIARRARLQGAVILQAVIDVNGEVTNIEVLRPLALGLTESAVSAVSSWKFKPATLDGKPIPIYYTLTVQFTLVQ